MAARVGRRRGSRSRPHRAGSGCAAERAAPSPRRRTGAPAARRRRCPADPRTTMLRSCGVFSHAVSSCSEPITFTSCIVRSDIPGPGRLTIWLCTTVSTRVGGISVAIAGSRMSAWISSVRAKRTVGRRVSSPATYSTSGIVLEPAREVVPRKLPTPVMRTRRATSASACSRQRAARSRLAPCAGTSRRLLLGRRRPPAGFAFVDRARAELRQALLDRVEPLADPAQLRADRLDVVLSRWKALFHGRAERCAGCGSAPSPHP